MRGRDFLQSAARLAAMNSESDWRTSIGRSYYALYLECREALRRWGFPIPSRSSHREVAQRLSFPNNVDLAILSKTFQDVSAKRNKADYELAANPLFQNSTSSIHSTTEARTAIALLDALESDPVRLAAAIAAIRGVFP
jgi:hypothetical protein